ncbi:hypothetical protein P3674_22595, partial [Vibrio parahaemolyticus]|nr:hypothetical protein [Vibrio parahaemolyticus]MDF5387813.1 hypothetical protein [Vibrio parahaemolyticus]MDF5451549.1 hypothetical protein [Vibrio parahaemolyticus]
MKISKSNPHQIVKNQHIFPSQSLVRFYDGSRTIGVAYKDGSKAFRTKANNSVFCVNRAWMRISVIAIARFGLFRSPDPAIFLSSY